MKLYRVRGADWFGTQAEAKTGARQLGRDYDQVEVPTDKPGLLDWLNSNTFVDGKAEDAAPEEDPLHAAEQRAIAEARRASPAEEEFEQRRGLAIARRQDTDALIDWMLEAQPWQLERVFEAMATRLGQVFGERSETKSV